MITYRGVHFVLAFDYGNAPRNEDAAPLLRRRSLHRLRKGF